MRRGLLLSALAFALAACGGGGGSQGAEIAAQQGGGAVPTSSATPTVAVSCDGQCADTPTRLTDAEVKQVIGQVAAEAEARNLPGTIAVVDRVGNVLAVYAMDGAPTVVTISSTAEVGAPVSGGLESLNFIPAEMAAIAKAVTGAYLSTEGNAFTTRTASQIVQENFNPGEFNQPSGPLFGVQFSQLPCGDFVRRHVPALPPGPGPHRSPLGLAADPGGFPLYKSGTPVGGVGFIGDGVYGLDKIISSFDDDLDEIIALAGTVGFSAPVDRRADVITAAGKTFRYADWSVADLLSDPAGAQDLDARLAAGSGALVPVTGYYDGTAVLTGTAFGHADSGVRPAAPGTLVGANGQDLDAFVFVDENDQNRFPPSAGTDQPGGVAANALTAEEVETLIEEAITIANRARAQIRRPLGTSARVTVSVVDTNGVILGMARTRDGPVFGADVSIQKARTATFFSSTGRVGGVAPADVLRALPPPKYLAPVTDIEAVAADIAGTLVEALLDSSPLATPAPTFPAYLAAVQSFLGVPRALEADGPAAAFADRSGGNLSRPNFPDGVAGNPPGPFSKPAGEWSIFSVGLQSDLVYNGVIQHVAHVALGGAIPDAGTSCTANTGFDPDNLFQALGGAEGLANGIQIFPGSVPIYRGDVLVGGIGVSGDGVDQDDMISLLGVHNAGLRLARAVNNAPVDLRADQLTLPGHPERLRYVSCPQAPFIDSDEDDVCDGK